MEGGMGAGSESGKWCQKIKVQSHAPVSLSCTVSVMQLFRNPHCLNLQFGAELCLQPGAS